MKIALMSDLHLEFRPMEVKNQTGAKILILAGDICIAEDLYDHRPVSSPYSTENLQTVGARQLAAINYRKFFDNVSREYEHVVYVAGNHEFYHGKWVKALSVLRNECSRYTNIHFLENDVITVDDITFVGSTLWTSMNKYDPLTLHVTKDFMNDYNVILNDDLGFTKLKPASTVIRHNSSLSYFKQVMAEHYDRKFVVVSHHAPSFASVCYKFKNEILMNGAYASDLSEFILDRPQIKAWVHGHMHSRSDYKIGDTRVMANPRGYPGESEFDVNFIFEV